VAVAELKTQHKVIKALAKGQVATPGEFFKGIWRCGAVREPPLHICHRPRPGRLLGLLSYEMMMSSSARFGTWCVPSDVRQ
jgi:hypothetical protein